MQLSPLQCDVLQEMINIGIGKAAGALNQMTGSHIRLEAPRITVLTRDLLFAYREEKESKDLDIVKLVFNSVFSGVTGLIFDRKQATALASLLLGRLELADDADILRCDTLREVGNIVLIWIMGVIGSLIDEHIEYLPLEHQWNFESLVGEHIGDQDMALSITAEFLVESHRIPGEVIIMLNAENFAMLLGAIDSLVAKRGVC